MRTTTILLSTISSIMIIYAWRRHDGSLERGLLLSWHTFRRTAGLLFLAFAIIGLVSALAPEEIIKSWLGPQSGLKGLLIAEISGILIPGGPFVVYPLVASIHQAGAAIGPTLAILTSWSSMALITTTFEIPFMGWRFTVIRYALVIVLPLLVGLAATLLPFAS